MVVYHQTKFGCKRIILSEDTVQSYFDCILAYYDLDSNPILLCFLRDTPAYSEVSPYRVWLRKVERFRRYFLNKAGHTDSDSSIAHLPVTLLEWWGGGGGGGGGGNNNLLFALDWSSATWGPVTNGLPV